MVFKMLARKRTIRATTVVLVMASIAAGIFFRHERSAHALPVSCDAYPYLLEDPASESDAEQLFLDDAQQVLSRTVHTGPETSPTVDFPLSRADCYLTGWSQTGGCGSLCTYANWGAKIDYALRANAKIQSDRCVGLRDVLNGVYQPSEPLNIVELAKYVDLRCEPLQRMSVSDTEAEGNGPSRSSSTSSLGKRVAFESWASNLTGTSPYGSGQSVYVRDVDAGTTVLAAASASGTAANAASFGPSITPDGRYVAFLSSATNLAPPNIFNGLRVFLKDLETGTVEVVSQDSAGVAKPASSDSVNVGISSDGNRIVYQNVYGLVIKDRSTGDVTQLYLSAGAGRPCISADGNTIGYQALGGGGSQIYVKNLSSGVTTLVSKNALGAPGNGNSNTCSLSSDGSSVAFDSSATDLVVGDSNGSVRDIFVYQDGTIKRVTNGAVTPLNTDPMSMNAQLSATGRYIVFQSRAENLVVGDTHPGFDIFVWDAQAASMKLASANSLGIQGMGVVPSLSPDGEFVTFYGADAFLTADANLADDVYRKQMF